MKANTQETSTLPSGNDIHLSWHLRLPAPLERDFADYFRASVATVAPWAVGTIVVLLALALALEVSIAPQAAAHTWRPRLFCMMVAVATAIIARRTEWRRFLHGASLLLAFSIALTGDWMGLTIQHRLSYALFLQTALAILMISLLLRVPFYWAVASSILMIAILGLCFTTSASSNMDQSLDRKSVV